MNFSDVDVSTPETYENTEPSLSKIPKVLANMVRTKVKVNGVERFFYLSVLEQLEADVARNAEISQLYILINTSKNNMQFVSVGYKVDDAPIIRDMILQSVKVDG